jgi:hypothetical protein
MENLVQTGMAPLYQNSLRESKITSHKPRKEEDFEGIFAGT